MSNFKQQKLSSFITRQKENLICFQFESGSIIRAPIHLFNKQYLYVHEGRVLLPDWVLPDQFQKCLDFLKRPSLYKNCKITSMMELILVHELLKLFILTSSQVDHVKRWFSYSIPKFSSLDAEMMAQMLKDPRGLVDRKMFESLWSKDVFKIQITEEGPESRKLLSQILRSKVIKFQSEPSFSQVKRLYEICEAELR